MDTLTEQQQQIMAIESQFWRTAGAKEQQIRAIGLPVIRYYQLLAALIQTEAAMTADPLLVKRLLRVSRKGRPR
jgi:hypothetical protein